jgi:uncharacterized membrane protein YczE
MILALGLILYTKADLGVSPIISIPYGISVIFHVNLGNASLCIFLLCVLGQLILRGKNFRLLDMLQIPLSIVFSRVMNIFNDMILIECNTLILKLLVLIAAILFTGIGAAITIEMKIMPTAPDGFAQAIAERMRKGLGLAKNILDISCVLITLAISLLFAGKVIGIGIGTLASVLGVGRTIALFNYFFKKKMIVLVSE